MSYIFEAFLALLMLGYLIWAGFTVYFVMISKKVNDNATIVGRIIWYHGVTFIFVMVGVVALTAALVLAEYLTTILKIKMSIGG